MLLVLHQKAISDVLNGEALTGGCSGDCSSCRTDHGSESVHNGIEIFDFESAIDSHRGSRSWSLSVDMRGHKNKHSRLGVCDRRKCEEKGAHLFWAGSQGIYSVAPLVDLGEKQNLRK
jgi:hypothetical protein